MTRPCRGVNPRISGRSQLLQVFGDDPLQQFDNM
jgi:hypothetical protein